MAADYESRDGMGEEGVFDFEEFNWAQVTACEVGNCTEVRGCTRDQECPVVGWRSSLNPCRPRLLPPKKRKQTPSSSPESSSW